jgi:homoserine dehydrogenase
MHIEWMKMGINVVTANNSSLSGDKQLRKQIRDLENSKKVHLLREVTVGGGLPVISTLRNLLSSGDKIRRIVSISFLDFISFQI